MSEFFINRPIFATVISIVIVIAGMVSFSGLPVAKFPEVSPPMIQVSAVYPGANARSSPRRLQPPSSKKSTVSKTCCTCRPTVPMMVPTDCKLRLPWARTWTRQTSGSKPRGDRRAQTAGRSSAAGHHDDEIVNANPANDQPDFRTGGHGSTVLEQLCANVKDELSRIYGVGKVGTFGAGDYSMRIWIDPRKLKSRNLTTEDVTTAIQEQNVQVAAGQIGAATCAAGNRISVHGQCAGPIGNG